MQRRNQYPETESAIKFRSEDDQDFDAITYKRPMGTHKPKFESIPDGYYPPTWGEGCLAACITYTWVLMVLGIMIGFIRWAIDKGTDNFVLVWSIIFVIWIPLMILIIYLGSRNKKRMEREQIELAYERQKAELKKEEEARLKNEANYRR